MKKIKSFRLQVLMLNMFIVSLGIGLIVPVLPIYIKNFQAGGQTMGMLFATFAMAQFLLSPKGGEFADRYGRRKGIVLGISVFTFSQVLFAFGTELWHLYVARFLGGAGAAFLIPAMFAYVADITTEENRGKGMGWLNASMSLGFVIGPGIGGYLVKYGISFPFYINASVAVLSTMLSIFFLPETFSTDKQQEIRSNLTKQESLWGQLLRSTRSPYTFLLVLIFVMNFGLAIFEAIFSLYVNDKHRFTAQDIAFVITVASLLGVIFQAVTVNALIKRWGEKTVVILMLLGTTLSFMCFIFATSYAFVFVITLCIMSFTSILRPAISTLLSKMAGEEQGFVAGMNTAYMSLGNIMGPILAGAVYDIQIDLPFVIGATVLFISFIATFQWGRRQTGNISKA